MQRLRRRLTGFGVMLGLLVGLMLLSACAGGSARGLDVCGPWEPVRPSAADVLTDGTARQILAHNEVGAALCGWR